MSHQSSIHDRLRPTRRSRKSVQPQDESAYAAYQARTGDYPRPEEDVTPEQLAALRAPFLSGGPLFVDLAVWGPFGHRIQRKLRLSGQTLGANSVFRTFLLCSLLSVFEWHAGWAILKTGATMLQVLRVTGSMSTNGWTDGTHKHNGFGGRLCAEPYCDEVRPVVKRLLADYENDKRLAFNNYTDSCPELTMKRLQTMEGFDYADELPFGPLPWSTGFPAPGYVPKTNPLNGHWATVSGGDAVTVTDRKLSTDSEGKVSSISFRLPRTEFYISHLRTSPRSMTPRSMSPLSERRYGSDLDVHQDSRLREITRVVHLMHDQAMPDARVEMAMGISFTVINPDDLSNDLDTTQKGFDRVHGADMSFNNEYE